MPDQDKHTSDEELLSRAKPMPPDDDDDADPQAAGPDRISINDEDHELEPIEVGDLSAGGMDPSEMTSTKITAFDGSSIRKPHDEHWQRTPNTPGTGAIHVKTFVAKLRMDAMDNLDQQVNQWLDAHPEYEVKMVTTTVGELKSKLTEQALFMNVWV